MPAASKGRTPFLVPSGRSTVTRPIRRRLAICPMKVSIIARRAFFPTPDGKAAAVCHASCTPRPSILSGTPSYGTVLVTFPTSSAAAGLPFYGTSATWLITSSISKIGVRLRIDTGQGA